MDKAEISPKQTFRMPVCSTLTNKEASTSFEFRLASSFPVPLLPESKPIRPFLLKCTLAELRVGLLNFFLFAKICFKFAIV